MNRYTPLLRMISPTSSYLRLARFKMAPLSRSTTHSSNQGLRQGHSWVKMMVFIYFLWTNCLKRPNMRKQEKTPNKAVTVKSLFSPFYFLLSTLSTFCPSPLSLDLLPLHLSYSSNYCPYNPSQFPCRHRMRPCGLLFLALS